METIFFVEGEPQGKARPRFSRLNGRIYTPTKTAKYEKRIRAAYLEAGGKQIPEDCYVRIVVDAYFKIPKSILKENGLLADTTSVDQTRSRILTIFSKQSLMA